MLVVVKDAWSRTLELVVVKNTSKSWNRSLSSRNGQKLQALKAQTTSTGQT